MPAPSERPAAAAAAIPAETEAAMAAALIDPARPGPRDPRFAVHRNNVVAGLVDALAETYPAVERLVGAAFFHATAVEFVRAHPPRSPVLLRWGGAFADWLAAFPPAAGLPYLPDLARLEWARCEAFHAADAAACAPERLTALAPEAQAAARLVPHPSLRLVASRFAVGSLWADATGPRRGGIDLARPEAVLVARPDWSVDARIVEPSAAAFLTLLIKGRTLGEIADVAGAGGFDLTDQLVAAFAGGLIADIA
jgi:hypothetical protein